MNRCGITSNKFIYMTDKDQRSNGLYKRAAQPRGPNQGDPPKAEAVAAEKDEGAK